MTFKALQTYQGGEVVRWIGPPDGEEPAPVVTLTAAEDEHAAPPAEAAGEPQPASASGGDGDDGGSDGLAIAALIVGALGLVAGVAGLAAAPRARTAA